MRALREGGIKEENLNVEGEIIKMELIEMGWH